MTGHCRGPGRRPGVTLIELLVVVVILAVLVSLLAGGSWKAFRAARRTQTKAEIAQLEVAIANFQNTYQVDHIPSLIWLDETGQYDPDTAVADPPGMNHTILTKLQPSTQSYLERVFGRHLRYPIDWNGDGIAGNTSVVLEGQQCLVFFLGGIRGTDGFAANPTDPSKPGGSRKGPFYTFDTSRLVVGKHFTQIGPNEVGQLGFFSYADRWGTNVYAYFSSYGTPNGYNRYVDNDCGSLIVYPYYDPGKRYLKPSSCQILCAGPDGVFGVLKRGWSPDNAGPETIGLAGIDDLSNFSDRPLGSSN